MKCLLLLLPYLLTTKCANILGVFPAPGYSQFILGETLMKELAIRGHQVTVISPFQPKNEPNNYKTILTDNVFSHVDQTSLFHLYQMNLFSTIAYTYELGDNLTQYTLENSEVQKLIHSKREFDVVIVEHFFDDALKGLASHFHAPLVLLSSMGLNEWNMGYMGVPMIPSINALCYSDHTNEMTFIQRFRNIIGFIFDYLYRNFVSYPLHEQFLKEYISKELDFYKILNNASLMLLNSDVTTSETHPLLYNTIEIGGFHVVGEKLTEEVQKYLDEAKDGAILFSLGSNLNSGDLGEEKIQAILKVLARFKEKVLWKFEKHLPNKPSNVYISKWFNQRSILAHPNVKLFITHGGLLSTTEAISYGVPMLGIPIFADQKMNMARAERNGIGRLCSLHELTEETFFDVLNETLNNPLYQGNMKRISSLHRDRPMKPLDLAIYWIEYVIRHKGFHFESPTLNLYWFQVYMFDIALFPLLLILILCKITSRSINKPKTKTE